MAMFSWAGYMLSHLEVEGQSFGWETRVRTGVQEMEETR